MRLIIIPEDTMISIDGEPIEGCDVSWVPEFVGDITGVSQKVHAVQWYDDHGEIELVTRDNNIEITELGIFEQAIAKHAERKAVIEKEAAEAAAAAEASSISYNVDIDALLAELESEENVNVGVATT
jgi:hypothetical protein